MADNQRNERTLCLLRQRQTKDVQNNSEKNKKQRKVHGDIQQLLLAEDKS